MPSNSTLTMFFYYTYVLLSLKDNKYYIGYTNNLKRRIEEHNSGKNFSTKSRKPFKLIYCEVCLNEDDAKQREKYFKSTIGRRYLSRRLWNWRKSL
ncbi:MAG: GIY-YIG nuclease family protein [Patescibacteria group bacterium]